MRAPWTVLVDKARDKRQAEEARVLAALGRDEMGAAALAHLTGFSETKIHDILDRLGAHQAVQCHEVPAEPIPMRAVYRRALPATARLWSPR